MDISGIPSSEYCKYDTPVIGDKCYYIGMIVIWTDGSVTRQGGSGAWACLIVRNGVREAWWGVLGAPTTSNRAELAGAIGALDLVAQASEIVLMTDSRYVQRVAANPSVPANRDLAADLSKSLGRHQKVSLRWVRGHSGVEENEFVDYLAKFAVKDPAQLRLIHEIGHISVHECKK